MKIRKLIAMKEECENKIECLELALGYANEFSKPSYDITSHEEPPKITLSPEQAQDIHDLLTGYKKLLNMVIDSAEVDIG